MARNDRIARLLALANVLARSRRGMSLRRLADENGWSLRALYRDIEALEKAGFPLVHEDHRYRLLPMDAERPAASVDDDELLGLFLARQLATGWKHTRAGRGLDRLWSKLTAARSGAPALVPLVPGRLSAPASLGIDYAPHRQTIEVLEQALADRCAVASRYVGADGTRTELTVEPGELYWDASLEALYLIGYCRLRRDVRIFAVHRFVDVALTDERVAVRPETASRSALRAAFRVWRGEHAQRVLVAFRDPAAVFVRERRWHASQILSTLADGRLLVTLEVAGLEEVSRWLLGFGAAAEALEPPALVQLVRNELVAALTQYQMRSLTGIDKARAESGRKGPTRARRRPSALGADRDVRSRKGAL